MEGIRNKSSNTPGGSSLVKKNYIFKIVILGDSA